MIGKWQLFFEIMPLRKPDIAFIPTPDRAIDALLDLAQITASDVVYDLGCGEGQILITAAQQVRSHGVGIDIDAVRIEQAQANAKQAGVSHLLQFRHEDLFESQFAAATVVILYLLPHLNLKLRPALFRQLKPGTRIVSIDFDMADWLPEQTLKLDIEEETTLYYWTIPG